METVERARQFEIQKWKNWIEIAFTPSFTATEFLRCWCQALNEIQETCGADAVNSKSQFLQFMAAVKSHPGMEFWDNKTPITRDPDPMKAIYKDFLDYAGKFPSKRTIVVFLARSSSGQREFKNNFLTISLEYTRRAYELHYGPLEFPQCDIRNLTFVHGSNDPFRPGGEIRAYFANLRAELKQWDGKLLMISNGWDGLTTNQHSFYELFNGWGDLITFRIYADKEPGGDRLFFQASISQVCQLINGERAINEANSSFSDSTKLFFNMMNSISDWKGVLGFGHDGMKTLTELRNTPKEMRANYQHQCQDCKMLFKSSRELCIHKNHKHKEYEDPEANLDCSVCHKTFARKDHRDRHLKKCKGTADDLIEEMRLVSFVSLPPRKRAKRGTKLRVPLPEDQPRGSDNGLLSYRQMTVEIARHLPRLDIDLKLRSDFQTDTIYKGELFCRYPGCIHVSRYSEPTKLRVHYRRIHDFVYLNSSFGVLTAADQAVQDEGLEWLARCCQLGLEKAGQRPRCPRK